MFYRKESFNTLCYIWQWYRPIYQYKVRAMTSAYEGAQNPPSVVVLGSGQGSTAEFFCKKIEKSSSPPFQIKALVTENPKSGLLTVARCFKIPFHVVPFIHKNFAEWDQELCRVLTQCRPRLVLLAGFLKKIGPVVLNRFEGGIINSHPSLLPEFSGPGMYGQRVHEAVLRAGRKQTGVSVHIVTANYDEGPLLAQQKIPILPNEKALALEQKVKKIEKEFYFKTVIRFLSGEISGVSY